MPFGKLLSTGNPNMNLWEKLKNARFSFTPRGWIYQNIVNVARLDHRSLEGIDIEHDTLSPHKVDEVAHETEKFLEQRLTFTLLAAVAIPNYVRAEQITAHNQTIANEAQIVCALERYRLAHGEYPATLDALSPQFIEKVPHDLIGGNPLIYRQTPDGKFLLYSIGWNEKDDGGQQPPPSQNSGDDYTKGDWVWKN